MRDFKVGDKVVIVKNFDMWSEGEFPESTVLNVVDNNDDAVNYLDPEALTIEVDGINGSKSDFKLVDAPFGGFVSASTTGLIGETVAPVDLERTLLQGFKNAITESHENRQPEVLGVYRPNLEDRKVGKVRVELVDKGFPNALWEIARLMTKAQEVKGYADHDWKNLPNWKESFSAAASRHRMKHNKGEFFDDEFDDFEILHKVNEAFNVLAELELLIVNKTHG